MQKLELFHVQVDKPENIDHKYHSLWKISSYQLKRYVVFTTSLKSIPASAVKIAFRFSITLLVCDRNISSIQFPVEGQLQFVRKYKEYCLPCTAADCRTNRLRCICSKDYFLNIGILILHAICKCKYRHC